MHAVRAGVLALATLFVVAAGGAAPHSRVDGFTLRTAEPVQDIAIDGTAIVYSAGASDCRAIERWRVGESRTYRRKPRCPRRSYFDRIAATGDSVAWIVTTPGGARGGRYTHRLSVAVERHRARTIAGALGPAKRVGYHFGELAGDDDRLVFIRQRSVDPGGGAPFLAGWASFVYDGTSTHRIGAGGGGTGFGLPDGLAFRDGVVAVLWDAGTDRLAAAARRGPAPSAASRSGSRAPRRRPEPKHRGR